MAGDWIKMRAALCTHPKVLMIADIIGTSTEIGRRLSTGFSGPLLDIVTRDVTRDVTLAALLRVWCATNEHTDDGIWHNSTLNTLDYAAGIPGFGEAMSHAGWAIFDEEKGTVTLPNFLENNAPAKNNARSTSAERQAKYRNKLKNSDVTRDVTMSVTSNAREEKRREELNTPLPPAGGKASRKKLTINFPQFLEACKTAGEKSIPDDHPVFAYADNAGIPRDFLRLHWMEFRDRYSDGSKPYKDWRAVFSKSVRGNWFRLWATDQAGKFFLTTTGVQAQNLHKAGPK